MYNVYTCDENTPIRSLAQKLLMKMVGMIDVSGATADYMNVGGKLHHSTRRIRRVGLSDIEFLLQEMVKM